MKVKEPTDVKVDIKGKQFTMNKLLKDNLDLAKKVVKKKWDMLFVVDGIEGVGKSCFAQQIAGYCDPTLNLDRVVFNPKEFMDAIDHAEPTQAIIYDEAYGGLSSRGTLSQVNKVIITRLTEIRRKQLFIFVCMPCFIELDKYVALWRSRGVFHILHGKNFKRGYFKFYNTKRKIKLYIYGKKNYYTYLENWNFRGRFNDGWILDHDTYDAKKEKSTKDKEPSGSDKAILQRDGLIDLLYKLEVERKSILNAMNKYTHTKVTASAVTEIVKRNKEKQTLNLI